VRIRSNSIITAAAGFALVYFVSVATQGAQQAPAGQRGGGAPAAGAGQAGPGQGPGQGGAQRGGRGRGNANANAAPAGPTPRLPNGKPDLSGHWANPYTPNMGGRGGSSVMDPMTRQPLMFAHKGEAFTETLANDGSGNKKTYDLPFTELGLKMWKEYDPVTDGDYAGSCMPFGMSRNINSPHGVQLIQNNDALAFLFEQNTWFHFVPTNPSFVKWPADLPQAWNGVSTGHWDGDTLIIETKDFHGWTRLDTAGHPNSSELVMTNTFLRTDSNTIQHTVTVHDPKMYTQDWMNVRVWRLKPANDVLMEYSCEENNRGLYDGTIKTWHPPDVEP
jgi:hypothetical protein